MRDFLEITLPIFLFVSVILGIAIGVVAYGNSRACVNQGSIMGVAHQWNFFGGCMIEIKPGKWMLLGSYQANSIYLEGK